jgi:hypothetical protein
MFKVRALWPTAIFFLLLAVSPTATVAQTEKPSANVAIETKSIGAGIGFSWGHGRLQVDGEQYRFSVDGVTLLDVGISKATAVGEVYNLFDLAQFEGHYVAAEANIALGGGIGGVVLRNPNGVIMRLSSVSQGARLHLGSSGVNIKFW